MTLNRYQAPPVYPITHFTVKQAVSVTLGNGIRLHTINSGTQPVIGLNIFFNSGKIQEPASGVSYFTNKMLTEGTAKRTARQISDEVGLYGSFIEVSSDIEHSSLTIYTLSKFLPNILPLLAELLSESVFPSDELENLKKNEIQSQKVREQKTAYIAGQEFRKNALGAEHPHSKSLTQEAISEISRQQLQAYFHSHLLSQPFELVMAGDCNAAVMQAVEATLGQLQFPTSTVGFPRADGFLPPQKHQIFVPKADSTQASVRVGRTLFNRNNPDYLPLRVLNEIFGGYFGSRLMKNIREEKGFTYGISSSLASTYADGYWIIGADVNKDVAQQTIDEIYKEMEILCKEPVPADELETVRNYMLGSFANSINTPFLLAERFKTVHFLGMNYDYYEQFIRTVQTISAEELLSIAQKHYKLELMTEVIVGGEKM